MSHHIHHSKRPFIYSGFEKQFTMMCETVYLFKFLFPLPAEGTRQNLCKNFNQYFLNKSGEEDESLSVENHVMVQNSSEQGEASDTVSDRYNAYEQMSYEQAEQQPPQTHRHPQVPNVSLSLMNKGGPFGRSSENETPATNRDRHSETTEFRERRQEPQGARDRTSELHERSSNENTGAKAQKPGKFMIPNLNLSKNLNQPGEADQGLQEPPTRQMRIGVDVYNSQDGGNPGQGETAHTEDQKLRSQEDSKSLGLGGGKMKFALNLSNVTANRFGGETAREKRDLSTDAEGEDEKKLGNERHNFQPDEVHPERGESSEDMEDDDFSYRLPEESQKKSGLQLSNTHCFWISQSCYRYTKQKY